MPSEVKWGFSLLVGAGLVSLGWKFPALLVTLHVLVCFMLVLVVLLQSGKAADLAGAFGGAGSQTAFGPRGAATFLSKATTWCAIMFMVTTLSLVLLETSGRAGAAGTGSVLEKTEKPAESAPAPFGAQPAPVQGTPTAPAQQPPAQPTQQAPAQTAPAAEKSAPAKSQPPKK
jgi:preprotein translocase subunit SecG